MPTVEADAISKQKEDTEQLTAATSLSKKGARSFVAATQRPVPETLL